MKKTRQLYLILLATKQIGGIEKYNQILLGTIVLRMFRHPEESLKERIQKASDTMIGGRYSRNKLKKNDDEQMRQASMQALKLSEGEYGKNNLVRIGIDKTFRDLDAAIEKAEIPKDCILDDENVICVLKYLQKESEIFLKVGNIEGLNDDEITFLVKLFKERAEDHENKSLEELVEIVMKENGEFKKISEQSEQPENPEERRKKGVRNKIRDLEDAISSADIQDIPGISEDNLIVSVLDYVKS